MSEFQGKDECGGGAHLEVGHVHQAGVLVAGQHGQGGRPGAVQRGRGFHAAAAGLQVAVWLQPPAHYNMSTDQLKLVLHIDCNT